MAFEALFIDNVFKAIMAVAPITEAVARLTNPEAAVNIVIKKILIALNNFLFWGE